MENQLAVKTGFAVQLRESVRLQEGYAHANAPVPSAALTPLTVAIATDTFSAGVAYAKRRYRMQFAYQVNLPRTASVASSSLLAGEYRGTRTSLWLQTIALTTGVRF